VRLPEAIQIGFMIAFSAGPDECWCFPAPPAVITLAQSNDSSFQVDDLSCRLRQDQYLVNPPRHLKETLRQVVGANVDRPLIHYAIKQLCCCGCHDHRATASPSHVEEGTCHFARGL
jgi:hypothetical protein